MSEQLDVRPNQRVLEVGTGSGYQAAILSRLAREVISVERYRTLADAARERLATLGLSECRGGGGRRARGVPERAPFDRIMVTAAAETIPDALVGPACGGRCHGASARPHAGTQRLIKLTKIAGELKRDDLLGVRFVPFAARTSREL